MKKLIAFCLLAGLALAADQRSKEEIENENLKLRLLLKKMEMEQDAKKEPAAEKKVKKPVKEAKWYYGTGLVLGVDNKVKHNRVDIYFLNSKNPSWTYKVGYAQNEISLDDGAIIATANGLVVGAGYNLYSSSSFFADIGLFYFQLLSEGKYDKTYIPSTLPPGGYAKVKTLELKSSPGLELGLGFSFGNLSIRSDITFANQLVDFEADYYGPDNTKSGQAGETTGVLYFTLGLTYWF